MPHCGTIIQSLRLSGFRITPQREMIIEAIAHSTGHVSAEEVFDLVRQRVAAVNIATVYRTLDLLVERGLASRADLLDGRVVYASRVHGPHLHLVCRQCGVIMIADHQVVETLDQDLQARYQFKPDLGHLSIAGLCADCQNTI